MKLLHLLTIGLLAGCDAAPDNGQHLIQPDKVDAELLPHVLEFEGYCRRLGLEQHCQANFAKLESVQTIYNPGIDVLGRCHIEWDGSRYVEINAALMSVDSLKLKGTVIHELGHCILGQGGFSLLPHYDAQPDLMNTNSLQEHQLRNLFPELVLKLFTRVKSILNLNTEDYASYSFETTEDGCRET